MNDKATNISPKIGEIYLIDFGGTGSEQLGRRPGLIFQNNTGNNHSPNVIALPLTSSIKKLRQPTHVLLSAVETGILKDSVVLCENPERIAKQRIGRYITTLSRRDMGRVAEAYLLSASAISFLDQDTLLRVWATASKLNATNAESA